MRLNTQILAGLTTLTLLTATALAAAATTSSARFEAVATKAGIKANYAQRAAQNTAAVRSASGRTGHGVLVAHQGRVWLVTADHVFGRSDTATARVAGKTFKVTRAHRGPVSTFSVTMTHTGGDLPVVADLAVAATDLPATEYGVQLATYVRPRVFSHAGAGRINRVFNDRWFMFSRLSPGGGSSGSGVFCQQTGQLVGVYAATTDVTKTGIYVKPQTIAAALTAAGSTTQLAGR